MHDARHLFMDIALSQRTIAPTGGASWKFFLRLSLALVCLFFLSIYRFYSSFSSCVSCFFLHCSFSLFQFRFLLFFSFFLNPLFPLCFVFPRPVPFFFSILCRRDWLEKSWMTLPLYLDSAISPTAKHPFSITRRYGGGNKWEVMPTFDAHQTGPTGKISKQRS